MSVCLPLTYRSYSITAEHLFARMENFRIYDFVPVSLLPLINDVQMTIYGIMFFMAPLVKKVI